MPEAETASDRERVRIRRKIRALLEDTVSSIAEAGVQNELERTSSIS